MGLLILVIGIQCLHSTLAMGKVSFLGSEVGIRDLKVLQCHYHQNLSPYHSSNISALVMFLSKDDRMLSGHMLK